MNNEPHLKSDSRFHELGARALLESTSRILWFLSLTILAGIAAYYRILTGFNVWDDEGALMLSVRQFLAGMRLYDQVPNYGPVYYFYEWFLHRLSHTPVTHDVVRLSSLLPWLFCALVCAWIILRLTRSLFLASVMHLLSFWQLSFFKDHPGHPQELCIAFLLLLVASGVAAAQQRQRRLAMVCIGSFTAALFLTKVNVGVFMMLAAAVAMLSSVPRTKFSRAMFLAVVTSSIVLPLILMKAHIEEVPAERYCLVVMASTIAMLFFLDKGKAATLSLRDFWLAVFSFSCLTAGMLLILIVGLRNTPAGILNSLVLANFRVSVSAGHWYVPVRLGRFAIPWMLAALCAAFFTLRDAGTVRAGQLLLCLKLAMLPASCVLLVFGHPLLGFVTPFCWLVLCLPEDDPQSSRVDIGDLGTRQELFPRTLLCSVAILQTLYSYPIATAVPGFTEIPPLVVAVVCCGDVISSQTFRQTLALVPSRRVFLAALLLMVSVSYAVMIHFDRKAYYSLTPLAFPGAEKLRIPASQSRDYHWLVRNFQTNCDVFFGMPELPSLHIWANSPAPAGLGANAWMIVYTDAEQAPIAAELSRHPRACVFYNAQLVGFWNPSHQNMDALPLARYLHRNFKVVGNVDDFSFLVRNDRTSWDVSAP